MTTKDEWRDKLSDEQFRVCWQQGTERPFSGALLHNKAQGSYHCVCCQRLLFESASKFDSGCGWPSFSDAVPDAVQFLADHSHNMLRTEVRCGGCGAHLGHLFNDGPAPSGQRYCINSVAMNFSAENKSAENKNREDKDRA